VERTAKQKQGWLLFYFFPLFLASRSVTRLILIYISSKKRRQDVVLCAGYCCTLTNLSLSLSLSPPHTVNSIFFLSLFLSLFLSTFLFTVHSKKTENQYLCDTDTTSTTTTTINTSHSIAKSNDLLDCHSFLNK